MFVRLLTFNLLSCLSAFKDKFIKFHRWSLFINSKILLYYFVRLAKQKNNEKK